MAMRVREGCTQRTVELGKSFFTLLGVMNRLNKARAVLVGHLAWTWSVKSLRAVVWLGQYGIILPFQNISW